MAIQASVNIIDATDMGTVRGLFREYAAGLGIDLCFQGFEAELAGLPGAYERPRGRLLIAADDRDTAGCVALRPFDQLRCEMKRLFVRPNWRASGVGRQLAVRIIEEARAAGYAGMVLDTLDHMLPAIKLYESLGFVRIAPYYRNPIPSAVYMQLKL